jgi:lactate dehydrogenase-like 2-hydroxyacid dehydrogenase
MTLSSVLVIDPSFAGEPEIERSVLGDRVAVEVWRPRGDELVPHDLIGRFDAVMNCRSRHRITAASVAAMTKARLVVQSGVGFNHIDVAACAAAGIPVCNTPDYGTREVADHAIALMLTLIRGTAAFDARLRTRPETWSTFALALPPIRRLGDLTFGVIGLGRIGLAAARRARAFDLTVAFHDPHLEPGYELAVGMRRYETLDELLAAADVVSVHCPLTEATTRLIDDRAVAAMKPGAVLINTARGGVVDLDAVERGLRSGKLGAAGLDVLPQEPPDRSHPLLAAWARSEPWLEARLVVTPHAAFYTPQSLADMRRLAATAIRQYFESGRLRSCVNLAELRAHGRNAP